MPIPAGATIVGFTHLSDATDAFPAFTTAIALGVTPMTFNSAAVQWVPFPEDIQLFYLTNVPANQTQIVMTISVTGGGSLGLPSCADIGIAVYSGVKTVTIISPVWANNTTTPSVTVTPTGTPALILGFASPFATALGAGALTSPSTGYRLALGELEQDDIGLWASSSMVQPGSVTLTFDAPQGTVPPGCFFNNTETCPAVVGAAALQ